MCTRDSLEHWLKSFLDAKMVITDSFHGMVFSIILNKPFWVIINSSRGAARFNSLLKQFDLEDRIVKNPAEIEWFRPIDWKKVNTLKKALNTISKSYLLKKL